MTGIRVRKMVARSVRGDSSWATIRAWRCGFLAHCRRQLGPTQGLGEVLALQCPDVCLGYGRLLGGGQRSAPRPTDGSADGHNGRIHVMFRPGCRRGQEVAEAAREERSAGATAIPPSAGSCRARPARVGVQCRLELGAVSLVEQPEEPHLRLFTADDEHLWDSRPRLSAEEFAFEDVTDEEWDAFYACLAEA